MSYPYQSIPIYTNLSGDVSASGYYRSSITQQLANMMPPWMHMRDNRVSIGQQFLSVPAVELKRLEQDLNDAMRSQFLPTARADDIDVIYRIKLPDNINLLDASASGVRCVAAPSGCSPSGVSQIWVKELSNLKEFYYDVLPTRVEVLSPDVFEDNVNLVSWHIKPSGILDGEEKHIDVWGKTHKITWCYVDDTIRKQDYETLEDYEIYSSNASGYITDMEFYRGKLWALSTLGSDYFLTIYSAKTQFPNKTALDVLSVFKLTDAFSAQPSGILVDNEGNMVVCDTGKTQTLEIRPRYDYFIMDKNNRFIYCREDYRDSGVFISNT